MQDRKTRAIGVELEHRGILVSVKRRRVATASVILKIYRCQVGAEIERFEFDVGNAVGGSDVGQAGTGERKVSDAGFFGQIGLNNAGDVAFEASTTLPDGSIDEAVYYYSGGTKELRRLAGIGTIIPGYGVIVSLEQVGALVFPGPGVTGLPFS